MLFSRSVRMEATKANAASERDLWRRWLEFEAMMINLSLSQPQTIPKDLTPLLEGDDRKHDEIIDNLKKFLKMKKIVFYS